MENLFFYPTITEHMAEDAGCFCGEYEFSYYLEGSYRPLKPKGKSVIKLEDELETWKIENDGLRIIRKVVIEYPKILKGSNGIACEGAEIDVCIIWTNRTLKQMGYIIRDTFSRNGEREIYNFKYEFSKGLVKGDITLETVIYIKKAAEKVQDSEKNLINETGVSIGTLDIVVLNFENLTMDFPIKEITDKEMPLWWLELNQWEDPRRDPFNEDYVCLYLNTAYDYCPKVGKDIKNNEILVEIMTTAYLMIIQKISDMGYLNDTFQNNNLEQGCISLIIYYFYLSCKIPLQYQSIDILQKTIHQNITEMLKGSDES